MNENATSGGKCQQCGAPVAPDAPEGLCPRCLMALNLATQTDAPGEPAGPNGTKVVKPLPFLEDIGKRFPQLEILECLGRGGMGVVYKARQPRLDRFVALKILAPERENEPRFAERFAREAKALARLNHPNIVTVHDFGEVNGLFYLMMEFVDGATLRQLIKSRKIAPEEALAIVPKICDALQYAHNQGVVHRDIKPENVLLDKGGRVKIADFGIARILGTEGRSSLTEAKQVVGTPHYMAPEQVEKPATVDHRADIYSLGVVFYEMLTGELPLGKFAPPSQKVHVDVRLDEVVLRSLEKEPERRYQQASEVKTRVETIAASGAVGGEKAEVRGRRSERGSQRSEIRDQKSDVGPSRLSRAALIGAIWALFFFVGIPPLYMAQAMPSGGNTGPAGWQIGLMITLLVLGFTAPFGATILGWIAVARIRNSADNIYGLGLALIDGLLFPLLALDVALGFLWHNFPAGGLPVLTDGARMHRTVILTILTSIVVDFLVVLWAWRTVREPEAGASYTSPSHGRPPTSLRKTVAIAGLAIFVVAALVLGGGALLYWLVAPRAQVFVAPQPVESRSPNLGSSVEETDYVKADAVFWSACALSEALQRVLEKRTDAKLAEELASQVRQKLTQYNQLVPDASLRVSTMQLQRFAAAADSLKREKWDQAINLLNSEPEAEVEANGNRLEELAERQGGATMTPASIALDRAGNAFVTDTRFHVIRKLTPDGKITTLAGNPFISRPDGFPQGGYADGVGKAAQFDNPFGLAIDAAGNLYVGDFVNHVIRKVTTNGVVTTIAGFAGTPGNSDGVGAQARFHSPHGVAADAAGNIYVADQDNHTIRKLTPQGTNWITSTIAGLAGASGSADGPAHTARFNGPSGVALDEAGNVFVADTYADTIRKISADGIVTTLAGSPGRKGYADGKGNKARFYEPFGIAVDRRGNVVVADTSNSAIRQISPDGLVSTVAGGPRNMGAGDGVGRAAQFSSPYGLTIDASGNIYVTDYQNHAVRRMTRQGDNWTSSTFGKSLTAMTLKQ